ncbi:MAG TPA: hypothetical protein VNT50_03660 [Microbacterium sp.]|uniref:hypothetical protein n=1 Tax=Microbacterium sp. TaxID=51671 RepID=UPI002C782E34|nr:hypothetical protein [Microbacterium sp.]HWI30561.1 hypothetical protein [Microbacterium sp.]
MSSGGGSGPTSAGASGFRWWIVIVAVVAVLLLVGAAYLVSALTRPEPDTLATTGELDVPVRDAIIDLETAEIFESTYGEVTPGGDVWFSDTDTFLSGLPGPGPLFVSSFASGIAVVPDGGHDTCRAAMQPVEGVTSENFVEVPDASEPTFVCLITGERQYAVLEIAPQEEGVPTRVVSYAVWGGTA